MAGIEQEMNEMTDEEMKDMDTKEIPSDQIAVQVDTGPPQSKKRVILEKVILCVALFFPLFLATLDTSTFPHTSC